ncbi:DinB family protein [Mycobacterium sp.]|uniref:DinB family protein n=1 Tax=Mycobacterium sp. TaxID=1785 RepID=UPI002C1B5D35|nr:DinB family protein [Mycobacterium sp.]HKP41044.1 DinB family protein [Mycobacterium sp.]
MTTIERLTPPLDADERTTLESWLDFYRSTLALKCEGLDDHQLRTPAVSPSQLTLLGLVQHLAEVERNWFRRILVGEQAPPIYSQITTGAGHDGGFELSEQATYRTAVAIWQDEIAHARRNCKSRQLDDTSPFRDARVSLRWIYIHMIAEYARHCGHADLIRERLMAQRASDRPRVHWHAVMTTPNAIACPSGYVLSLWQLPADCDESSRPAIR